MYATINVKKGSGFEKHNGEKFKVDFSKVITAAGKLIFPLKGVRKEYPNNYTDFTQDELIFSHN
jgi:hypothetical protein